MVPGCGWVNPTNRNQKIILVRSMSFTGGANANDCKIAMVLCNYISIYAMFLRSTAGGAGKVRPVRNKSMIDHGFRERPS